MIVDLVTHVMPRVVMEKIEKLPKRFGAMGDDVASFTQLFDLDERFRTMEEFGEYRQIISLSGPSLEEIANRAQGTELSKVANDAMADMVRRFPDRFPGFLAALSLHDVDDAVKELTRAGDGLGAVGVQVFTEVGDRAFDDPQFEPVLAAAAARNLMILLHPARTPDSAEFKTEPQSLFGVWQTLSWPFMTSVVMWRLICRGVFDKFPDIKILAHHLGGIIPYHANRVERGLQIEPNRTAAEAGDSGRKFEKTAREYLRMYYGDTAMHGAVDPVRCGLSFFGPGHVAFASDAPFGSVKAAFNMIDALGLDDAVRRQIEQRTAEHLTGLRF